MADMIDLGALDSTRRPMPATLLPAPREARSVARVRHRLPAAFGAQMKSMVAQGISSPGTVWAMNSAIASQTENMTDVYTQEPWIAAAWNLLSSSASQVPLRLWDRDPDDEDAVEITTGPLYDLFQRPAVGMDPALRTMTDALNMAMSGESLWLLLDAAGNPVGSTGDGIDSFFDLPESIQPVTGFKVEPKTQDRRTGEIFEWQVTRGGAWDREVWPYASTLHLIERPDHRQGREGRGLGQLAQAYNSAIESWAARRYTRVMLENLGDPGGIVEIDSWLTDDQYDDLTLQAEESMGNPSRSGAPLVLQGGAKYNQGRITPRDMAWEALLASTLDQMAAIVQTPKALLGMQAENYATFRGHFRTFITMRLRPFFSAYARRLNSLFFPRLRDPSLRHVRARFDLEMLSEAIGDLEEQGAGIRSLTDAGVSLDEALRQGGIKSDPIPGGDVSMVVGGAVSRQAAILLSQAQAAAAAIAARMEAGQAWELAGVEGARLEDPPEPIIAPGAGGGFGADEDEDEAPEQEDDPEMGGAGSTQENGGPPAPAKAAGARDTAAADGGLARHRAGASPTTRDAGDQFATEGGRLAYWLRADVPLDRFRSRLVRDLRAVSRDMARAQIRALEDFAAGRPIKRSGPVRPTYADPMPTISPSDLTFWRAAEAGDALETAIDRQGLDEPPATHGWCGCEIEQAPPTCTDRRAEWVRRHTRYAGVDWGRLDDLAVLREFTEAEIDNLLIVQDDKWAQGLAEPIEEWGVAAYEHGVEIAAQEAQIAVPTASNPAFIRFMRDKSIEVAEGNTSALARRLRSDIIGTLAKDGTVINLREAVAGSLKELKATTTRAFNTHAARAQAIARTEMGQSWGVARWETALKAYEAGAISHIIWVTSGRAMAPVGTVRPTHFVQDGMERVPGQLYPNQMKYPHEPSAPAGELVNCACHLGMRVVPPASRPDADAPASDDAADS